MKRATGNNTTLSGNEVSIQLPLGGHSFSFDALPEGIFSGEAPVEFRVLTPRTTLVPREAFDEAACEAYLAVAGLKCRAGETAVAGDVLGQIVPVMAIDSDALRIIRERFGARASFATPLCDVQKYSSPAVWLCRTGGLLYIKVYNTTLRFAEVIEPAGDADMLQILHDLDAVYGFRNYAIHCHGERPEAMRKLLKKYYSDVRCE